MSNGTVHSQQQQQPVGLCEIQGKRVRVNFFEASAREQFMFPLFRTVGLGLQINGAWVVTKNARFFSYMLMRLLLA